MLLLLVVVLVLLVLVLVLLHGCAQAGSNKEGKRNATFPHSTSWFSLHFPSLLEPYL